VSDDDSTYHFDPAEAREVAVDDAGEPSAEDGVDRRTRRAASDGEPRAGDREFGWRGWVLVGMLFVALVVVPVLLYFVPRARWLVASLGLGYRDAFLVFPLLPAIVLALLAVWATTRP
jgi:hypothetical protein